MSGPQRSLGHVFLRGQTTKKPPAALPGERSLALLGGQLGESVRGVSVHWAGRKPYGAFFDSVSNAAVSASALSLRRSSRSSCLIRLRSALRA